MADGTRGVDPLLGAVRARMGGGLGPARVQKCRAIDRPPMPANMTPLSEGCVGCRIAQNALLLDGGWTLNHYGGREGFFGWLAIQPREHVPTLRELRDGQLRALGPNLSRLERGIYDYWAMHGHTVDRV